MVAKTVIGRKRREANTMAVAHLMRKQKRSGTVADWLPGYKKELEEVTSRRLRPITDETELGVAKGEAIGLRMLLEAKSDGRQKGRLILLGYLEPSWWDFGATDSPVATMATIRTLLFQAGPKEEVISSVDVATAFLQAEAYGPDERVRYVKYKPFPGAPDKYFQLMGPIYGQRSASKAWFKTVQTWLEKEQGFAGGKNEPCVFTKDGFRVVLYVDDIVCRGTMAQTKAFYEALEKKFKIKDPEILTDSHPLRFLGFDIRKEGDVYSMDQEDAIRRFLEEVELPDGVADSPMPRTKALYEDMELLGVHEASEYRSRVGSLNYFAMGSRYDIAHATSRLSQFSQAPTKSSQQAMERVLVYLRTHLSRRLRGARKDGRDSVAMFSDSDHGGDRPHELRSQTGMVVMLNGVPVLWSSKKQSDTTAFSSTMAEIFALSETVKAGRLWRWRAQEMGMEMPGPVTVQVDSTGARSFQRGTCVHSRLGGVIDFRDAWVEELRESGEVETEYVRGEENLADLLTKCFPTYKFKRLMHQYDAAMEGCTEPVKSFLSYVARC